MRSFVSIIFLIVLMAVLATGLAFAAVEGSPHDVTEITSALPGGTVIGTCSICHVPHKTAGAERLWAAQMGAIDAKGEVGALCYACHGTSGGYAGTTADASQANNHVFPDQPSDPTYGLGYPHRMWATFAVTSDNSGSLLTGLGVTSDAVDDMHQLSLATWTAQFPYLANTDSEDDLATGNEIQCTSCHNVHDNTERPFLRTNARDLCVACHLDRGGEPRTSLGDGTRDAGTDAANLNGSWTGGTGVDNNGSHPVGTDVDGTLAGARTPFIGFGTGWFQAFDSPTGFTDAIGGTYTDGTGIWQLGRHAASTGAISGTNDGLQGGVVCISCHAVHGVATEVSGTGNSTVMYAVANLLGVAQTATTVGNNDIAYGQGDPANFLCETCHVQPGPWADATTWAASSAGAKTFGTINFEQNDRSVYIGNYYPNPGGSSWSHPMDDAVVINKGLVTAFAANWPYGVASVDNAICESCHTPHPRRSVYVGRADVNAGAGAYILRDTLENVCNNCHGGTGSTVLNHHPVGSGFPLMNMTGTGAPSTGTLDSTTLNDSWGEDHRAAETLQILAVPGPGVIGDGNGTLTCNDCHNSEGTVVAGATATGAAHNWSSAMGGIGLDPNWDGDSKTCEDCHYLVNNTGGAGVSEVGATPAIAAGTSSVDLETPDAIGRGKNANGEFQESSDHRATHFLGAISDNFWQATETANISPTGSLRYAAFEGGVPTTGAGNGQHLICESCHTLHPKHNGGYSPAIPDVYVNGYNAMLVINFEEGRDEDYNALCEACHGRNPGGNLASGGGFDTDAAKTHPLTLQGTSYRTGALITSGSLGVGRGSLIIIGNAFSALAGQINCDSCHQVHSALTLSGTLILDAELGDAVGIPTTRGGIGGVGPAHPSGYNHEAGERPEYQGFCQQCHAY